MSKFRIAITTSVAAIFLLAGAATAQTNSPTFKIESPTEGQTVYGDKIPVLFSVENFTLTDPASNPTAVIGQGHIIAWLDDQNPAVDTATKISDSTYTFSDVIYGDHTLKAELVANDSSPLTPPQIQTIKFKTSAVASDIPSQGTAFDKKTATVILVVVALVIIAAWWYTKDDEDEIESKSEKTTKKPASRAKRKAKKRTRRKAS